MRKASAGMGDKMKEKKEEYSYIVNRNREPKHRSKVRKVIAIFSTLSLLMGAFLLVDQLAPWIAYSKEDTDSLDKAEVDSFREISLLNHKVTVPAALTTIEQITNDSTSVNVILDYEKDKIYIKPGPRSSTKLYFSQDKMKTWEKITGKHLTDGIDVSVFLKTSDNTIYVKGDLDKNIVAVKLPKEDKDFKVSYYVENGNGFLKFENQTRPVEYRKGTYGEWKDFNSILDIDLASYEITGYTLQFRQKATTLERAGRVVSVKIPKRQAPPKIRVDYSKMEISGLKAGQTLYYKNGETKLFNPEDSKVKTISLYELLFQTYELPNSKPLPAASIEFQTMATDKKVASAIVVVDFQAQPGAPSGKILVDQTTVTFPEATKTTPYEYVVLHLGETLDLTKVKWTKVTSNKPFEIKKVGKATPAPGDVIYYRLASTTNKETKVVTPASMYANVEIKNVPITN